MPYRRAETYASIGTKGSWNLDPSIAPFSANIAVTLSNGGVASYKLQYTLDPLDSPTAVDADASWFDSPDIPALTAASASSAIIAPVARIRLVIASLTGSLTMEAIQGLSTN